MPAAIPIAIAGGSIVGGLIAKSGAESAADAQSAAAANASATQLQMYNQSRADQAPWRQAGGQAVNALSQWYGLGGIGGATPDFSQAPTTTPGARTGGGAYGASMYGPGGALSGGALGWQGYDPSSGYRIGAGGGIIQGTGVGGANRTIQPVTGGTGSAGGGIGALGAVNQAVKSGQLTGPQPIDYNKILSNLPGYQFQLSQGENAVQSNLAARGLLQSGAAGKALTQYGQGVASDYATQYINGLQSLAGLGQTSAANTGALGGQAAGQIGSNMLYGGNAQASGYVGQANAINSGLSGLVGAYGQYRTQQNQLYNQQYDQLQPFTPTYIPRATDPYQDPYAYGGGP